MNLAKTFTAARFFLAAVFSVAASCAFCAEDRIWDDRPGDNWENSWYPLGNGRLGCMVDGGARKLRIQFNVDSLWTGDKNLTNDIGDDRADANYKTMGAYQNFGELEIELPKLPDGEVTDYRRELNLESAMYNDKFKVGKVEVRRLAFASVPDDAIFIVVCSPWTSDDAFELKLSGAHGESVSSDGRAFCGTLANGLDYAARVDVFTFPPEEGFSVKVFSISAATGVKSIPPKKIDGPYVVKRHFVEYGHYYDRMTLDLGEGDKTVPTRTRLERVKKGGKDPALIALMFNFGRYLLISSSRPGTLPANLQG